MFPWNKEDEMEEKQLLNNDVAAVPKKPYSKPTINKVQLVAKETVLANCKYGVSQAGRTACVPDVTCVVQWRS